MRTSRALFASAAITTFLVISAPAASAITSTTWSSDRGSYSNSDSSSNSCSIDYCKWDDHGEWDNDHGWGDHRKRDHDHGRGDHRKRDHDHGRGDHRKGDHEGRRKPHGGMHTGSGGMA